MEDLYRNLKQKFQPRSAIQPGIFEDITHQPSPTSGDPSGAVILIDEYDKICWSPTKESLDRAS